MPKRPLEIADLLRIVSVSDPSWRPNSDEIFFTCKKVGEKFASNVQICSINLNGESKQWTSGDSKNWSGKWNPEGSQLAFLSNRSKPGTQIHLLNANGGEAAQVTKLPEGSFGEWKWSPDGKWIAFAFRETHPEFTEKASEERKGDGRSTPPKVTEKAHYRLDGDGFFLEQRHKIYLLEIATGESKCIFDQCPLGWFSLDWSPDSRRIALTATTAKNPWIDPIGDEIFLCDLKGNSKVVPGLPNGEKTTVRWSPDGKQLAYLGGDDPNDHRSVQNIRLFVCPVGGGSSRCISADLDLDLATATLSDTAESPSPFLEWMPDSKIIAAQWAYHGQSQVGIINLETGQFSKQTTGNHVLTLGSLRTDGLVACLHSSPTEIPEIAVANIETDKVNRLTKLNEELTNEIQFCEPVETNIEAEDGYPVHLWTIRPKKPIANPNPTLLEIHGGPQCQYGWTFFFEFQLLAANEYTVVYSNPRGSKGYGMKHVEAIAGHWGGKDWADIAAVKDWIKNQPDMDSSRIGVEGGSYGGYMVNWAVGHTTDFKAAITDRCVSNLVSKSLNTDYPYHPGTYWMSAAYQGIKGIEELWRDSPIAYFENVTTPMLIIHSEGDLRCHIEQGEQVFTALQELGVPCRFVRYPPSTSHGMSRGGPPDLRMHRLHEILDWWKRWLQ